MSSQPVGAWALANYKNSGFEKNVDEFLSICNSDVMIYGAWKKWLKKGLGAWREMTKDWFSSLGDEKVVVGFDD